MPEDVFSWARILSKLVDKEALSESEAAAAMAEIMEGLASPAQIAAFAVALRAKGESSEEIVGLVRTMRAYAQSVEVSGEVLDTCGTGGDRAGTFNISTTAALICAGAGAKVAKHGNRAASSRCGSADVLEALGVRIDLAPEAVARCVEVAGMGFCFAPVFHPAMRHAAEPRRQLGIATVFNFLGPLTNPAGAKRQVVGVSDPAMVPKMAEALARLGSRHVLAFHGHGGLDELSTSGPSEVLEVVDGELRGWTIDPRELGLPPADASDLRGGTAEENAAATRAVLAGEPGAKRDVAVLNAAAGLVASGNAIDMADGLERAAEAIDSGRAADALSRLIQVSNQT